MPQILEVKSVPLSAFIYLFTFLYAKIVVGLEFFITLFNKPNRKFESRNHIVTNPFEESSTLMSKDFIYKVTKHIIQTDCCIIAKWVSRK